MKTLYIAHRTNGIIGILTGTPKEITEIYYNLTDIDSQWSIITRGQYENKSIAISETVKKTDGPEWNPINLNESL